MNLIDHIIQFSCGLYDETCAIPFSITLPPAIFDKLMAQTAERLRQTPNIVPGSIPEIQVETGRGVLSVRRSVPSPGTQEKT